MLVLLRHLCPLCRMDHYPRQFQLSSYTQTWFHESKHQCWQCCTACTDEAACRILGSFNQCGGVSVCVTVVVVAARHHTSAGSAAQPAPTKRHRGIPSSSVRQFRQSLAESSMLLAVEAAFHIKSFVQKLQHILGLAVNQVVAICTTEEVSVTSLVSFTLTSHPNTLSTVL